MLAPHAGAAGLLPVSCVKLLPAERRLQSRPWKPQWETASSLLDPGRVFIRGVSGEPYALIRPSELVKTRSATVELPCVAKAKIMTTAPVEFAG
jgi:hypothetical protein